MGEPENLIYDGTVVQLSPFVVALVALIAVLAATVVLLLTRNIGVGRARRPPEHAHDGGDVAAPDYRLLMEATQAQLVEAELRSLRAQISPHFIYNSLNAIAGLIPTDPVKARELVIEFADFTRYSLRSDAELTTLEEELAAVERYVLLEKARFEDRIHVELRIAPEVLSLQIPFLAVQPLVENAVRHGLNSQHGAGHVVLTARDADTHAEISVEDDGVGADADYMSAVLAGEVEGTHIGLRNVDLRLRQVYGGVNGLTIETAVDAGMRVSMRIPKFPTRTMRQEAL